MQEPSIPRGTGPSLADRFQQVESSDDVCLNEISRAADRAVHVRFSGEMHHMGYAVIAHDSPHFILVPQIHLLEDVLPILFDLPQVGKVAGVGQAVEVDQTDHLGTVDDVAD